MPRAFRMTPTTRTRTATHAWAPCLAALGLVCGAGPGCERAEDPRDGLVDALAEYRSASVGGAADDAGEANTTVEHSIAGRTVTVQAPSLSGYTYRRLTEEAAAAQAVASSATGLDAPERALATAIQASAEDRMARLLTAQAVEVDAQSLSQLNAARRLLAPVFDAHHRVLAAQALARSDGAELSAQASEARQQSEASQAKAAEAQREADAAATLAQRLQGDVDTLVADAMQLRIDARSAESDRGYELRVEAAEREAQAVGPKARADAALAESKAAQLRADRWAADAEALAELAQNLDEGAGAATSQARANAGLAREQSRFRDDAVRKLEDLVLQNAAECEVRCDALFAQAIERAGQAVATADEAVDLARGPQADLALLASLSARHAQAVALVHRAAGQSARLHALSGLTRPLEAEAIDAPALQSVNAKLRQAMGESVTRAQQAVAGAQAVAAEAAEAFDAESDEGVNVAEVSASLNRLQALAQQAARP
ncbi:MAG: hypothetical protein AAF612_01770 [Planctomycetota bacterium]